MKYYLYLAYFLLVITYIGVFMKKIVLFFLLILVSANSMASDYEYDGDYHYDILFGIGYGQIKRTYDFKNLQLKDETYQDKVLLKIGFQDIETRMYSSLSYLEADKSEKQYSWMLNLEALSDDYLFYNADFKMFWGVQVGALKIDFEDKKTDKTYSSTNIAYGVQGGVLFDITKSIDLELGYESVWSPLDINNMDINGEKYNYSFDYNQNFYIGLNYSF